MQVPKSPGRVLRTKIEAKAAYDRLSRFYDLFTGKSEWRFKAVGLELLDVRPGEYVLEIGYGTGQCLIPLAQPAGTTVLGIDLSQGMLRVSQTRLNKAGLTGKVHLVRGDAAMLPYRANCLDAVFCSFTLELFDTPEIPIVLADCWRVLRQGGRICVVNMGMREPTPWIVRIYEWFHEIMPRYLDCRPIPARYFLEYAGFVIDHSKELSMFGLPIDILLASKKP